MTQEKMNVHKALAELKILDDRADSAIREGVFCLVNKHSNKKVNGVPVETYERIMQGDYDKANDHIRRTQAMRRAVMLSNAITKVSIGSEEYTVAEAIAMKNHGIELKKKLKAAMKKQYDAAMASIASKNNDLDEKAEEYVVKLFGGKEAKTSNDEFNKVRDSFIEANTMELIDPIHILDKINALDKEIAEFEAEVDSALSVSNALTEITFEY